MSQITKCYKVTIVLTYWEASGEVSELSYKSLLFITSKRSYCSISQNLKKIYSHRYNTITDGGVAPQCTFARPTYTYIEYIDIR